MCCLNLPCFDVRNTRWLTLEIPVVHIWPFFFGRYMSSTWFIITSAGYRGKAMQIYHAGPFICAWNQSEHIPKRTVDVERRYTKRPQVAWYSLSRDTAVMRARRGKSNAKPQIVWQHVIIKVSTPSMLCQEVRCNCSLRFLLHIIKVIPTPAKIGTQSCISQCKRVLDLRESGQNGEVSGDNSSTASVIHKQ